MRKFFTNWLYLFCSRKSFQRIVCVFIVVLFAPLYFVLPIKYYRIFLLQNFDYGIYFNRSYLISNFVRGAKHLATRGICDWGEHQTYVSAIFAPLHYLPNPWPHYAILLLHSCAIFAVGILAMRALRLNSFLLGLCVAIFVWLNPLMLNMNADLIHTEACATLCLVCMALSIINGRIGFYYVFLLAACSCKEDVAITVCSLLLLFVFIRTESALSRKHILFGFTLSLLIFAVNLGIVLPYYQLETCKTLVENFDPSLMKSGMTAPWFINIYKDLLSVDFWKSKFLCPGIAWYIFCVIWPIFVIFSSRFALLSFGAIPGLLINILGGGYLIQGAYHYDHSTFAVILIALLVALPRISFPRLRGVILLICAVAWNLNFEPVHPKLKEVVTREFWSLDKTPQVEFLEHLNVSLPDQIVISADYTSINYLLNGHDKVYMFKNPFLPEYFGYYGVCDGSKQPMNKLPQVDLVVLRSAYDINNDNLQSLLRDDFELIKVGSKDGRECFDIYISLKSTYRDQLRAILSITTEASMG